MTRRNKAIFIAEIDEAELACRILEGFLFLKRPPGKTAQQCLEGANQETKQGARNAARKALGYLDECIKSGVKPS